MAGNRLFVTAVPVAPVEGVDSRHEYPDVVRALGTIAVVTIHVSGGGVGLFDTGGESTTWWVFNVVDSACRWAVPGFVMLSGALLLDPAKASESAGKFYRKRIARIGVPLLFWSGFYLWLRWFAPGHTAPPTTFEEVVKPFLFANPYYHLYFLFVMVGLYLFTPALRIFTANGGPAMARGYGLAVLLFAGGDTLVRLRYGFPSNSFAMGVPYLGYFLLGYGLRDVVLTSLSRWLCGAGLVATVAITAIGTNWTMSHSQTGALRQYLYNFFSPNVCVMAVCVFLLLAGAKYTSPLARALRPVTRLLSDTSLGVYLVHPAVLLLAQRQGFQADQMPWWLYLPGVTLGVLVASVLPTRLIQATRIALVG
jgi:surface polysaccharide O-acyltransferase-like enzyme